MRMQRLDELLGQARQKAAQNPQQREVGAELKKLKQERNRLAG